MELTRTRTNNENDQFQLRIRKKRKEGIFYVSVIGDPPQVFKE